MQHALRVLNWQENLTKEEMPPEWMWPLDAEIVDHFEWVERERKERYGIDDDDDDSEMERNDTRGRGRDS